MFSTNGLGNSRYQWIARLTICLFMLGSVAQPVAVLAATTDVVNIAGANSAGVSHNTVTDYNVGADGQVLNNSQTDVQSQLAGTITGNSNLTSGSAKLILMEVTGTNSSLIGGKIEVAGQKADLVIANANGIVLDGAGFINVGRAVLTTGTATFGGSGSLNSFRVTKGQITVQGAGVDASGIDRLDLISRSLTVNAAIQAKELNAVIGANRVNYTNLSTRHLSGTGTSQVAIDVSALGGMYADKITLVTTDQGAGVNSLGAISATNGDVNITSAGKLTIGGATSASDNIAAKATEMDLSGGQMNAGSAITLVATTGDIVNTGGNITAGSEFTVTTPGAFVNTGFGSLSGGADGTITAGSIQNSNGFINTGNDLAIAITKASTTSYAIDNSNGFISAIGNLSIAAKKNVYTYGYSHAYGCSGSGGTVQSSAVTTPLFINNSGGFISAGGDLSLTASLGKATSSQYAIENAGGSISASKNLNISLLGTASSSTCSTSGVKTIYALDNSAGGAISAGNDLTITAQDASTTSAAGVKRASGCTSSGSSSTTSSKNQYYINNANGTINATGAAQITVQGVVTSTTVRTATAVKKVATACHSTNPGTTTTVTSADTTINNNGGSITTGGDLTINTLGTVDNTQGTLSSTGSFKLSGFSLLNTGGTIHGDTAVSIATKKAFDSTTGTVTSNGPVSITTN